MKTLNPQFNFRDPEAMRKWRETADHHPLGDVVDVILDSAEAPSVVTKPKRVRKPMSQWTFKESMCALFALVFLGTVVPFAILIGGAVILAIWDAMTR